MIAGGRLVHLHTKSGTQNRLFLAYPSYRSVYHYLCQPLDCFDALFFNRFRLSFDILLHPLTAITES